jgi:multidrug efflux pump subunit AcrA (membrane-fusion protein)
MDIVKPRQKASLIQKYWYVPVLLIAVTVLGYFVLERGSAGVAADADLLLYGDVERGALVVNIRGTGILAPREIRWIAANVEGRVERILIKPGDAVSKGELILELVNPEVVQQMEETQWELEAVEAQSRASAAELQSRLLDQKSVVIDAQLNYESAQLQLDAEATLIEGNSAAVSKLDYERSKLRAKQTFQRWEIEKERFQSMEINVAAQLNAQQANLNKMRKTLQRAEQLAEGLSVRASMDAIVQEVALEAGERISVGSNIAKLARQDELIAELRIPEVEIRDVAIGQRVIIDTRNSTVEGNVSRIDPAVSEGTVLIDVEFTEPLPADARPDLTVDGRIEVANIQDTMFVSRPLFAQSKSTTSVYRLTADGDFAERVRVRFGSGSINVIEVAEGLDPGDRIIISDVSKWSSHDRIRLD